MSNNIKATQFILARAACLLVEAYRKCINEYQQVHPLDLQVGPDTPNTFEALRADEDKGILKVSTEFNSTSIYGAAGNLTFRVFRDYGHLLYDAPFTTDQEILLAQTQWKDLERYIPHEWLLVCREVYTWDTIEQSKFESRMGHFPVDQRTFVLDGLHQWLNHKDNQL